MSFKNRMALCDLAILFKQLPEGLLHSSACLTLKAQLTIHAIFHSYNCKNKSGTYLFIKKQDSSPTLHINHVAVERFLTVVEFSSVLENNYEKWGPEQALTDISYDQYNYWHSADGDINPSITFRMLEEYETFTVKITDRLDCCQERFNNVEVRVGQTTSFDEAESCGIKSYVGQPNYK